MAAKDRADGAYCPALQHAVELVGRRWTGVIINTLLHCGSGRFVDIRASVPGLSDRLLAERLEELVAEGFVVRAETDAHPTYTLTAKGEALRPAFRELTQWSADWYADGTALARPGRIQRCGPSA
ncbi:MAG: winged helix-turn-helix transcriptional regulator [Dermatophilaceae bacterium]